MPEPRVFPVPEDLLTRLGKWSEFAALSYGPNSAIYGADANEAARDSETVAALLASPSGVGDETPEKPADAGARTWA